MYTDKYLVMLNSIYENGSIAEIIAVNIVDSLEEGELWFCNNKPEDGTEVDYTLHKLSDLLI